MEKSKLIFVTVVIGYFSCYSMSAEYISTDIAKGFSWRYSSIERDDCPKLLIKFIDYVIDSVWGNPADTFFFQITEHDSIRYKLFNNSDTTYTQISRILCKKSNRITQCDSFIISQMFSDRAVVKFDTTIYSPLSTYFSHPIKIDLNEEQYDGLQSGSWWSGVGTHMGSSIDTSTYCNKIGLLKQTFAKDAIYSCESDSFTITLLQYNGKDISFNYSVKTICGRKSTFTELQPVNKITVGRTNMNTSFNLLGQLRQPVKAAYGIQITKLIIKR
jgi:hypothetical protein